MTSKKNIILLFFALLVAYFLVGWGIRHTLSNASFQVYYVQNAIIIYLSLIFHLCYPPLSISYLFFRQVRNKFSRWGMIIGVLIILGNVCFMLNETIIQETTRYPDSISYIILVTPITAIFSYLVIGFACINKKQKVITHYLGYYTLISAFCVILFIIYILGTTGRISDPEGLLYVTILSILVISAPLALLSAVFLGLKEDEQPA